MKPTAQQLADESLSSKYVCSQTIRERRLARIVKLQAEALDRIASRDDAVVDNGAIMFKQDFVAAKAILAANRIAAGKD